VALWEVVLYVLVGIGFLGLIVWVALEAHSKD